MANPLQVVTIHSILFSMGSTWVKVNPRSGGVMALYRGRNDPTGAAKRLLDGSVR
jgi:hypothetical protein